MSETAVIFQAMRQRLKDRAKRPAPERFGELVAIGLIDKDGHLAPRYRGEAPENGVSEPPPKK